MPVVPEKIDIQIDPKNESVFVGLVESAPHNIRNNKQYTGVGAHLFPIACKISKEQNYDAVFFETKTGLLQYNTLLSNLSFRKSIKKQPVLN